MKSPQVYLACDFFLKTAGLLTAVAVAIATLGIPLPVPFVKDIAQAFPCMNCGCGCVNADMCWRQCCCYTNSEKLAWASQHGVQVPEFVLQQVATEIDLGPAELAGIKPCCRQRVLAAKTSNSCDQNSRSCHKTEGPEPPLIPGVLAIHALKCQGLSLSVSLLPPSVPTDGINLGLLLAPGEQVAIFASNSYQPPFFAAVVPPPEFAVL